jgi:ribosomal protein S18 acetylase RimI-like enzyme
MHLAVRVPKLDSRLGFQFIDELHVLEGQRRRGAATLLIEAVLQQAARLGYSGVRLLVRPDNHAAAALYESLGFTRMATDLCERGVLPAAVVGQGARASR